ncbi:hypothetical protein [[Scytonema hofmanni] UTEX B 1581]|uniref:hypothetical protein n=1 Tax=[Scytonema hofmanni] UTEX B 1581 TaxID=379535 RepID=UPI000907881A|nr:hypothetical protein [[Scytonema hofmanni] UTEX B 1581]
MAAALIVCQRGLAAVGYTVKMQGVWVNSSEFPRPKNPQPDGRGVSIEQGTKIESCTSVSQSIP